MKPLYATLFCMLICGNVVAQDCPETPLYISTEQQAQAFLSAYPDCTVLKGLNIINSDIKDLSFLHKIERIEGGLLVTQNRHLKSLVGLNQVKVIEGFSRIQNNDSLENISVFDSLQSFRGEFFYISYNPGVATFEGWNNLDSIHGIFSVFGMQGMKTVSGFQSLSWVKEDLLFHQNDSLETITGFDNLTTLNNSLRVYENKRLHNISFLNHPVDIAEWLEIEKNPLLTYCHYTSVCHHLSLNKKSSVSQNGLGCENEDIIKENCISGSDEGIYQENIRIFPNPAYDELTLLLPKECHGANLTILNASGFSKKLSDPSNRIIIRDLPAGLYHIQICTSTKSVVIPFIKY